MSELKVQSLEARMLIEKAGFGDVLGLMFYPHLHPPVATITTKPGMLRVLDDETMLKCLKVCSTAGKLLESYGWEVNY